MTANSSQLKDLRTEKKELLEQVMDKETYKVALDLLHRFSEKPALLRTNPQQSTDASPRTSLRESPRPGQQLPIGLQQRMVTVGRVDTQQPRPAITPASSQRPMATTPYGFRTPYAHSPYPPPIRTPFPVIDQRNKGVVEKLVDYLVGDGPSNRFAMICKQCMSHNGMALQEEYEYTTFKCAFCGTLNPSRKQRPTAPRLELTPERKFVERRDSTSEEEKFSGNSDSESEGKKKDISEPKTDTETLENQEPEAELDSKPETEKKED